MCYIHSKLWTHLSDRTKIPNKSKSCALPSEYHQLALVWQMLNVTYDLRPQAGLDTSRLFVSYLNTAGTID